MGIGLEPGVLRVWDLCVWSGDGRGELGGEVYFYGPRGGVEHVREMERGEEEAIGRVRGCLKASSPPTALPAVSAPWLRRKV
jgi:hypothetical protein